MSHAEVEVHGVGPSPGPAHMPWWSDVRAPPRAGLVDDRTTADAALRRAHAGEGLAYVGDWHNARQLLAAMGRRLRPPRPRSPALVDLFRAEREGKRLERDVLSRLAVPVGPGWTCPLPRAPALASALAEAFGPPPDRPALVPLREALGALGAAEWRRRGVPVPALGAIVHPWYGVFSPVRGEYVDLVAGALAARGAALGPSFTAFDVGTGTGVLALLLARAGARVEATDLEPRAVGCARENAARLGLADRVAVREADLFPPGRARLVVANPPWLPGAPHSALERAVYDPGGALLARLVRGLPEHLEPGGEAWLVLSDLAERLGLRPAGEVERLAREAGLAVAEVREVRPAHPRARAGRAPEADPIARARAAEVTKLYVLR